MESREGPDGNARAPPAPGSPRGPVPRARRDGRRRRLPDPGGLAFLEGRWAQAFPFFGVERRGAPVTAFARIAPEAVDVRTNVYAPDVVVVLDPSLLKGADYLSGLKEGGTVVANTDGPLAVDTEAYTIDATRIALEEGLGSRSVPIVNTAMVGALAGATHIVGLEAILRSIARLVPQKPEANRRAAERAFAEVRRAVR
ncbi:MAG TPA: 2-oxoacid:acceptor oxidoreductase family protein [Thermoplasmata archaeon]|nr:2-oxoacid:acceptor oxidoreductase family protein [Thermoplasmata archaeon]